MTPQLVHLPNGRLAIRIGRDAETILLAVPNMHPQTRRSERVRIFEYVLRGQLGLAMVLAETERDSIEARDRLDAKAAKATEELMSANWATAA